MDKFFIPDTTYNNAIKNKDIGVLRALLTGIIGSDPTFETTEFEEAKKYIDDRSITINGEKLEITEEYIKQEDEVDEAEWNEKYFQMNLVWLRDNFNLDNRLPKIKNIGKYVYKDKTTLGKTKLQSRVAASTGNAVKKEEQSVQKKAQPVRTTGGGKTENKRLIDMILEWVKNHWMIVAGVIVFVIVVIGLIAKLSGKN